MAVALGGAGLGPFVRGGADDGGGLGLHEQLQHGLQRRAHQVHTVAGAQCLRQLEQGRLGQGHHVVLLYESLGRFSQSLTR